MAYIDDEVIRERVVASGPVGSGMDDAEVAQLRTDTTALLARPVIDQLTDIPDVSGTPADGQVFAWNAASGTFVPISPGVPINVQSSWGSFGPINRLHITSGLTATPYTEDPAVAIVAPVYGSTANTVAAGNHAHTIRGGIPFRWTASGSHSSGTRTLTSGNVTGLDPANVYIIRGMASGTLRGEGTGAGYTLPRITIHGSSLDAPDRPRTVAGVQVPFHLMHSGVQVTGVSSITVSCTLAYSEGDPVYVGGGELMIIVTSNR